MKVLERCVTGLITRIFGLSICLTLVCGLPGVGESHAADFVATGSMSVARYNQTATLLPGGKVLIVGGSDLIGTSYKSAELYDPATGLFTPAGNMATGRDGHTATLLNNGKILIAGGYEAGGAGFLKSAELYDPATGLFTPTGSMGTARRSHTATLLANGKVLVAGGRMARGPSNMLNLYDELYDPAFGTFTPVTGSMATRRDSHTATRLADGKVLIAGGWNSFNTSVNSPELYDPATNTFSPTAGSMTTGRYYHTATRLANGKVLIAGGYEAGGAGFLKSAELYDPATGHFTPTGNMTTAREMHAATLLSNSKVLITGGMSNTIIFNSAELYDPDSETFTPTTGNMTAARYQQTSTLLPNNRVLITGGGGSGSYLSSAELYGPLLNFSLTVAISGAGAGSVTSAPQGIDCDGGCSASFESGTVVTLGAAAGQYSLFADWSGDCTGTACELTMNGNRSVSAHFDPDPDYEVRINRWPLPVFFRKVQEACNASQNGETVQALALDFTEELSLNKPLSLEGGYSIEYNAILDAFTIIHGSITIVTGPVVVRNMIIR
jgi:hypothetical protein